MSAVSATESALEKLGGTMKRIPFTTITILDWTPTALTYQDADGVVCSIIFAECRRNWAQYVHTSGLVKNPISEETTTGVAWRDAFADPPYIEFFTEPRTRFEFHTPKSWYEWLRFPVRRGWREAFHTMQCSIVAMGWSSFDRG